jgi:hypothetical protein
LIFFWKESPYSPQPAFQKLLYGYKQGEIQKRLESGFELSNWFWYLLKI